jgi:hypothetical protein
MLISESMNKKETAEQFTILLKEQNARTFIGNTSLI